MTTTIEIAGRRIRLCRYLGGKLVGIESFPIDEDADPILALREAPLPDNLGPVRIVMHHSDMLLRTMTQPSCPQERLQKIVEFEISNLVAGDADTLATWHLLRIGGTSDEMRILVLITKRTLLKELEFALACHGGRLHSLIHPGIGLFHSYLRQVPAEEQVGDVALLDVGGRAVHTVFTRNGELVFVRTNSPGSDALVADLAEAHGVDRNTARAELCDRSDGLPEDVLELVRRQASSLISTAINANLRFAKAQLRIKDYQPGLLYLAGAGAQTPGLREAMSDRMGKPVRIINPFHGCDTDLGGELDSLAALPSPWSTTIGAALVDEPELDAVGPIREEKRRFWLSSGSLRVAAVAAVVLVLLAIALQFWGSSSVTAVKDELDRLVPPATAGRRHLDRQAKEKRALAARLRYLASHRRPARVAVEILNAIGCSVSPESVRVVQHRITVRRQGTGSVAVQLQGFCEGAAGKGPDEVFAEFKRLLRERYPLIEGPIRDAEKPEVDADYRLKFNVVLTVGTPPPVPVLES